MLKSEMQHQYWVTKKVVQRKLGGKEDECVVSSDAELDAKIELFKSIAESCIHLHRVIDHYQERLCILAQEENNLGKFLKDGGKSSATTGKVMTNSGKAISYCGQQRMAVRAPLVRLHHEVDTFRGRAVIDTKETIVAMERARTEYRAALSWMKSASAQLDPDSGKGLEKFRKAQNHVRLSKSKFDRLKLDCLQKIDLLAAARCNMFSHALVAYQQTVLQFFTKTTETFKATSQQLSNEPHYNFCILKELTQAEKIINETEKKIIDSDQMLFFQDEYKDEETPSNNDENKTAKIHESTGNLENLIDIQSQTKEPENLLEDLKQENENNSSSTDLLGLTNSDFGDFVSAKPLSFMPSQLLLNDFANLDINLPNESTDFSCNTSMEYPVIPPTSTSSVKSKNSILDLFSKIPLSNNNNNMNEGTTISNSNGNGEHNRATPPKLSKNKLGRKDMSAWFQLFAELDPLSNPDAIENKIEGNNNNSHAA